MLAAIACTLLTTAGSTEDAAVEGATRLNQDGLRLELAPLTADQVRAFVMGRGFSRDSAELLVEEGCIFRSSIGSAHETSEAPAVAVKLSEWRTQGAARVGGELLTREYWDARWRTLGVDEDAVTAFHWALFPTEQEFGPTDYNWGFLSFALEPGSRFALEVVWHSLGVPHSARLEGLTCSSASGQ